MFEIFCIMSWISICSSYPVVCRENLTPQFGEKILLLSLERNLAPHVGEKSCPSVCRENVTPQFAEKFLPLSLERKSYPLVWREILPISLERKSYPSVWGENLTPRFEEKSFASVWRENLTLRFEEKSYPSVWRENLTAQVAISTSSSQCYHRFKYSYMEAWFWLDCQVMCFNWGQGLSI